MSAKIDTLCSTSSSWIHSKEALVFLLNYLAKILIYSDIYILTRISNYSLVTLLEMFPIFFLFLGWFPLFTFLLSFLSFSHTSTLPLLGVETPNPRMHVSMRNFLWFVCFICGKAHKNRENFLIKDVSHRKKNFFSIPIILSFSFTSWLK